MSSFLLGGLLVASAMVQGFAQTNRQAPPTFTPPPLPSQFSGTSLFAPGMDPNAPAEMVVMVDEPIGQVFKYLEALTGRIVLQQESMPSPTLNFNSQGKLTKAETVRAIETILTLNGVSVTAMGDKFIKAVPTASIRFQSPNIISGSALNLDPSQRHYSKVFEIRHLGLDEVTQIVNNLQTPGLSTQLILKKANSIMVTDSLTNLQQIERVLNKVDVPAKMKSEMVFRTLNYISAVELKDRLLGMSTGPLKNYMDGTSFFEADERTNQIIIVTDPNNMNIIKSVIDNLDVDAAPLTRTEVFYLKHAASDDVASLLNSLVSGQSSVSRDSSQGNKGGPPNVREGDLTPTVTLNSPDAASSNDQFSPYITIESDERSNAIIAFGTASDIRYVDNLISKVDIILAQVKIDVVIAEVNIGDTYKRGIDSFGLNLDDSKEITVGVNQLVSTAGEFVSAVADLPVRVGATLEDFTLNTVFQTAQTDSNVSIISAPTLVTTHNKEATIRAGEKRPIITASSTDSTGTSIRSQVQFQDIGIILTFKPLIGSNGIVQLEIEQTIDSVNGTTLIDGNEQPIVGSRSATSYVSVSDGEIIVLGGLQEVEKRVTEGRLFLLGQIPLLGDWLFSSKRDEEQVQDLVIFIRPQVIYDVNDAKRITDQMIERSEHEDSIRNYLQNNRFE
jgi:general secretion pathway protein D